MNNNDAACLYSVQSTQKKTQEEVKYTKQELCGQKLLLCSQKLQWVLLEQKQTNPQLLGKYLKEKTCAVELVGNHEVNFMCHKLGVFVH